MFATVLQLLADALLLGDVAREFFDVPLGLFDLRQLRLDAVEAGLIGEIDDGDDGRHGEEGEEADRTDQLSDKSSGGRAREVGQRRVEEVVLPDVPETLARAQRERARARNA